MRSIVERSEARRLYQAAFADPSVWKGLRRMNRSFPRDICDLAPSCGFSGHMAKGLGRRSVQALREMGLIRDHDYQQIPDCPACAELGIWDFKEYLKRIG